MVHDPRRAAMLGGVGSAMRIPTGERTWRDSVTGRVIRTTGAGSMPFNWNDNGTWRPISLAWSALSGVSEAPHRAQYSADELAMGWPAADALRQLRVRPERLIRFYPATRTWDTLSLAASPSAISRDGSCLYLSNVYPNVDRRIEFFNNRIFDGLVFHQAARTQLAALGGWADAWLGSVSDITFDFAGSEWRDAFGGLVTPSESGLLSDTWLELRIAGERVFALPDREYLRGPDGATWGLGDEDNDLIPVRSFLVVRSGRLKLIELFDPKLTVVIPPGDISHNYTFGRTDVGAGAIGLLNYIRGYAFQTYAGQNGTADTISVYLSSGGSTGGNKKKFGIYNSSETFLGGTVETDGVGTNNAWNDLAMSDSVSISEFPASYLLVAWSNFSTNIYNDVTSGTPYMRRVSQTYNGWPSSPSFGNETFVKNTSIHCDYSEAAPAEGPPLGTWSMMGVGR